MSRLFIDRPTAEEMVSVALGEIEPIFPCDKCLKECKKPKTNFKVFWCQKAEFEEKE